MTHPRHKYTPVSILVTKQYLASRQTKSTEPLLINGEGKPLTIHAKLLETGKVPYLGRVQCLKVLLVIFTELILQQQQLQQKYLPG